MHATKTLIMSIAALLLVGSNIVTAMPALESEPFLPNLTALIRGDDRSYQHSEDMAASIRTNAATFGLTKRSYGTVKACYQSSCTDCHTVWDGSFTGGTSCLSADNTACLIISNLDHANVEFWNHAGCNGRHTVWRGCGESPEDVSAPGTNSIGVHSGC